MAKRNDARKKQIQETSADKAASQANAGKPPTLKSRTAAYNLMRFDGDMRAWQESIEGLSPEEVKIKEKQTLKRFVALLDRMAK